MHQKKAQMDYVKAIIISLVVLSIVLAIIVIKFYPRLEGSTRLAQCKSSVEANARLHLEGLDFSQNIKCPAKDLTIKEKDPELIKRQLANEMVECWDIFKQGQEDLFSGEGTFCAICSRIDFEAKKPIEGFTEFIYTQTAPNKKKKYIEYLGRTESGEMFLNAEAKQKISDTINPEKTYSTILVYVKGRDEIKKFIRMQETKSAQYGLIAGGGVMVGAGAAMSFSVIGAPVGIPIMIGGGIIMGIGEAIAWFTTRNIDEWLAEVFLREYSEEVFQDLGCQYFQVEQSQKS
ncbi:hypothetical protein GOV06_00715 [Candidatus Woesearchaeota archaeon]|nr:hypothetical protein [Candidatus Woesearchaeota archaeon]